MSRLWTALLLYFQRWTVREQRIRRCALADDENLGCLLTKIQSSFKAKSVKMTLGALKGTLSISAATWSITRMLPSLITLATCPSWYNLQPRRTYFPLLIIGFLENSRQALGYCEWIQTQKRELDKWWVCFISCRSENWLTLKMVVDSRGICKCNPALQERWQ